MAAEPQRPDGWLITYVVEVVFDTNASRTGYDHVGTVVRCTCGEQLDGSSPANLARHARRHEPTRVAEAVNLQPLKTTPDDPPDRELSPGTRIPVIGNTPSLVFEGRR